MDGKQVKNYSNPTGTTKALFEDGVYRTVTAIVLIEAEIDFGATPISSKTFTIPDINITAAKKILVFPSSNPGTGRIGNDWEFDMPFFSTVAELNQFKLSVVFNHLVVGARKIFYQII